MPLTYPPAAPTVSGDITSIHTLLNSPTLVARRLRTLAEQRFIADAILTGRIEAEGGAVQYEQADSMYTDRAPEIVAPGMEFPIAGLGNGLTQVAQVAKWGQDAIVTDESIKRLRRNPVDRGFAKLINQMVKQVDSVALGVIASSVTASANAAAAWGTATAKQIYTDAALARANILALNEGYDPDTVVVSDLAWTYAKAAFVDAGYMPREDGTSPALTGQFPIIDGMRWLPSPNLPAATTALVLDSTQLGGMADEQLGGPGYTGAAAGVEAKSIRDDDRERYKLRARRVTVPIVIEPNAARKIANLGV